jgi:hypothetical protein
MLRGDQRLCDVCDEVIPRGTTCRCGYTTTPNAVKSWFDDAPELTPSCTAEADGTVRLDVCVECVAESEGLGELTEPTVDALQ